MVVTCKSFYGYSILPFIQLSMYLFAFVYLLNAELSYWAVIWELMFVDEEKQDNQGTSLIIISKKRKKNISKKIRVSRQSEHLGIMKDLYSNTLPFQVQKSMSIKFNYIYQEGIK